MLNLGQLISGSACQEGLSAACAISGHPHARFGAETTLPKQERALPTLAAILATPAGRPGPLLEGALDVVAALLRPAAPDQAACVHAALSGHVMALVLTQDDPGVLQSCSEYLRYAPKPYGQNPNARWAPWCARTTKCNPAMLI